jgi:DNA mismatch endonuclease Vsr
MSARRKRGGARPLEVDPPPSARLGRIRQSGTSAEEAVVRLLRELGVRAGRSRRRLPGRPDFVNLTRGWCIFVHGCFWHAHRGCSRSTVPKRNRAFWEAKFADNRARDTRVLHRVRELGYRALVLWECELKDRPGVALRRLARFVTS